MKPIEDGYILSTGKKIHANCRILGINNGDEDKPVGSHINDGYDGFEWCDGSKFGIQLTTEERKEISNYMINLWTQWGDYVPLPKAMENNL